MPAAAALIHVLFYRVHSSILDGVQVANWFPDSFQYLNVPIADDGATDFAQFLQPCFAFIGVFPCCDDMAVMIIVRA